MSSTEINTGRGEPFTTKQNDAIYQRLVSGDETARDEMIEGNMALVVYRVDAYLRLAPQMAYYRDDMISAGLVGLCEIVDRMQKKGPVKNPKPTGWLTKGIDCRISRLVDEANTIVVPKMAQVRARADGEPITPPRIVSDKVLLGVNDSAFQDRIAVKELYEETLACCEDAIEKQIVRMRADGYTDAEIGVRLNLPRRHISRLREQIVKRFYERCPEYILRKDRHKESESD